VTEHQPTGELAQVQMYLYLILLGKSNPRKACWSGFARYMVPCFNPFCGLR